MMKICLQISQYFQIYISQFSATFNSHDWVKKMSVFHPGSVSVTNYSLKALTMEGNSIRGHLLQLVKVQSIVQTLQSRGVMCSCPPVPALCTGIYSYFSKPYSCLKTFEKSVRWLCKKISVRGSQGVVLCNEYNEARCLSSPAPGFIVWVAADQGVDRRWDRGPPGHLGHHHLLHCPKQNNPGGRGGRAGCCLLTASK